MKFSFNTEDFKRLSAFNAILKNFNSIFKGFANRQLFVVKDNTLSIYCFSQTALGVGAANISFDVRSDEDFTFEFEAPKFAEFIDKLQSDVVTFERLSSQKVVFTGDKSKSKFQQVIIADKDEKAQTEMIEMIPNLIATRMGAGKTVKVAEYKNIISDLISLTKISSISNGITICPDRIQLDDSQCIVRLETEVNAITDSQFKFIQTLEPFIKNVDEFKVSDDSVWYLFDINEFGIKAMLAPGDLAIQTVTDDELVQAEPKEDDCISFKVKVNDLYNALAEFENMFDSSSWLYHQIRLSLPDDESAPYVKLDFDDMVTQVDTTMPVTDIKITQQTGVCDKITFTTMYLKALKSLIDKTGEDTLTFIYDTYQSGVKSVGVALKNDKLHIFLGKSRN